MRARSLVLGAALALGVAPAFVAAVPGVAFAQATIDLAAGVDNDVVEVGDTITYSLRAMVHNGGSVTASDPRPGSLPGFSIVGQSSMPVQMHTNNNGVVDNQNGLMTSWSLRADKAGSVSLGPASVVVSGARRSASAVRVRVVERGKGTGKRGPKRLDPFNDPFGANPLDPFKSLFDFGDDDRRQEAAQPATDPKLGMAEARAPVAFLHATIDKPRVVVGEQVTLNVYLYEDPYARQGRPGDVHEATATDFVKRSLVEDETRAIGVGTALVGGKVWNVKLVRKNALFPIKSGHLSIEPMSMTLPQARVGLRASEILYVDVVEPPAPGRPAGYSLGDVGDMSLQANVAPRAITQDGAIGVTIELRGTGNLPSKLTLPTTPDVEWLEQQSIDKLGPLSADRFGGTRTFSYVVRLHRAGSVELGEVKLPFFDPAKNGYRTASAALGIIDVKPGAPGRDAGVDAPEPILPGLPKERATLEGRKAETYLADRPIFWFGLFGSPIACALAIGAQTLLGRMRERRAKASPSLARLAQDRRAEATSALRGDDGKAALGAVLRALEAGVLAETSVNLRGASRATSRAELEEAGVSASDADEILAIGKACEDARFSPEGAHVKSAEALWKRAEAVLDRIGSAT